MYISDNVADRIKILAKNKKVSIKKVLDEAGLSFNTMANMKNSMPKADNLAKIADCLDCSVDYLLGRTDIPTINSSQISNDNIITEEHNEIISAEDIEILELIRKLPLIKRVKFISALYDEVNE